MSIVRVWKVARKNGEDPDTYTFSLKREGCFALVLEEHTFTILFPNIKPEDVPTAPVTAELQIKGEILV